MRFSISYLCFSCVVIGCSSAPSREAPQVVTTLPVIKLIVEPILGDLSVVTLLPNGASPHVYQPKPSDIRLLGDSQLIISAHEHIDGWSATLSDTPHFALFESVAEAESSGEGLEVLNPHYWSDPNSVLRALPNLVNELCTVFENKCPALRRRATALSVRIDSMSSYLEEVFHPTLGVDSSSFGGELKTACYITAQPFINRYIDRFGLERLGPISQEAEQEPTPASLAALLEKAEQRQCRSLIVQSALDNRAILNLARDMEWDVIEVDPLGVTATSYEDYLGSLAISLKPSGQ